MHKALPNNISSLDFSKMCLFQSQYVSRLPVCRWYPWTPWRLILELLERALEFSTARLVVIAMNRDPPLQSKAKLRLRNCEPSTCLHAQFIRSVLITERIEFCTGMFTQYGSAELGMEMPPTRLHDSRVLFNRFHSKSCQTTTV